MAKIYQIIIGTLIIVVCTNILVTYSLWQKVNRIDVLNVSLLQDLSEIDSKVDNQSVIKLDVTPSPSATVIPTQTEAPIITQSPKSTVSQSVEQEYNYEVLKVVAQNLNLAWNGDIPEQAELVINEFSKLDETGKIINGVWGENTPEYKVRDLILQGKTLQESKLIVDPKGDYWVENKPSELEGAE